MQQVEIKNSGIWAIIITIWFTMYALSTSITKSIDKQTEAIETQTQLMVESLQ